MSQMWWTVDYYLCDPFASGMHESSEKFAQNSSSQFIVEEYLKRIRIRQLSPDVTDHLSS